MGNTTMSGYSDLSDDAETWKVNFMANIEEIASGYDEAGGSDVDAFARSLAAKIPSANELDVDEGADELKAQLDTQAEKEQLQSIFDDYTENSFIPDTDEIKALIVQRSNTVDFDGDGDVDDQVMTALDEYADDWESNWSSSFGF